MKRAYKQIAIRAEAPDFLIILDGKSALTPFGKPLWLPNLPLAEAIVEEWRAQKETIRKDTMPLTQLACVAIDLVAIFVPVLMVVIIGVEAGPSMHTLRMLVG